MQPDSFTSALFRDLDSVEDTKPGTVARVLQPLLQSCPCPSLRLSVESYGGLERVKQASAVIHEPAADSENVHKFTAGLVLGITMDAEIENVENIKNVRVKVSKIVNMQFSRKIIWLDISDFILKSAEIKISIYNLTFSNDKIYFGSS